MASTHKHIRSSTANKRPTTAIADGQIALNTNSSSPGLFFKDSTGATIIKVGPVHIGATAPNATPPSGGSSGNSTGEVWLDTGLTPNGVKIWDGSAWVNATPIGSTTVQGLLELATNAETQTGSDTARAVTPAGLQSKLSDSTSTTSSTTIASSTAVKAAYDLANAALPKSGGTVTGNLEIGNTGSLSFEGATADAFETTIAVTDPTADRTITLPDTTGTVVTTGDTGTVTSTMIADGTIVDGDISASAEIAVSKLADGTARQLLQTDAAGTGVEWASNIDVPGTLDVTSTATFDSIASHPLGSAAAPTLTFTGDTNTGIYSPGADQVAISTNGTGRLFVNASGNVGVGTTSPSFLLTCATSADGVDGVSVESPSLNGVIRLRADGTNGNAIRVGGVGAQGNTLRFLVGSDVERMRIDSSGRLGLGTSSPSTLLHIQSTDPAFRFKRSDAGTDAYGELTTDTSGLVTMKCDPANAAAGSGFRITVDNSEALRVDSSGRLGIGSTGPLTIFDVKPSTNRHIVFSASSTYANNAVVGVDDAGAEIALGIGGSPIQFITGLNERARIDSSGRLLVGTSTALGTNNSVTIKGTASSNPSIFFGRNENASGITAGEGLGFLEFGSGDGGIGAQIEAEADGTWSSVSDCPSRLVFSTTADGAPSPTEAMRITSDARVLFGTTGTPSASVTGAAFTPQTNGRMSFFSSTSSTASQKHVLFFNPNGEVGSISTNASATAYTTSSDYRLKENIIPLTGASERVLQLKPSRFNFIADPDTQVDGFIAHEAQAVVPECVIGAKDEVDEDGNPAYQGIDQSKLVPLLTAALQEAIERIETLEAEVAALKGA